MPDQQTSQKTELPTPKRLRDAREEGNVAKSEDLNHLVPIVTAFVFLFFNAKNFINQINLNYTQALILAINHKLNIRMISSLIIEIATKSSHILLSLIITMATISVLANIIQMRGIVFVKGGVKFNFDKLNIANNFKQIFSTKNWLNFLKNTVKLFILIYLAVLIIKSYLTDLLNMYHYTLSAQIYIIIKLIASLIIVLLLVCAVFTLIDYVINYRAWIKQLMMSLEEIKQEHKETIGNPEIMKRRRELHQELLQDDDIFGSIKDTSIVLANPTHIAIVVFYSPKTHPLPVIMIKAKGELALKVFKLASLTKIPIVRDKWLARQLYALGETGKYVPKRFRMAMATIFTKNLHLLPKLAAEIIALNRAKQPGLTV